MRNTVGDSSLAKLDTLDLAQLVRGLLLSYPVDGVAALGVVDQTEVLASLLDGDDVHETSGVGGISADLAINLDEALHENGLGLARVEGILQAVAEEDDERHAVAELVRTRGSLGGIGTGQLVQEPVRGGAEALLVLLSTSQSQSEVFIYSAPLRCWRSAFDPGIAISSSNSNRKRLTYGPRPMMPALVDGCCRRRGPGWNEFAAALGT